MAVTQMGALCRIPSAHTYGAAVHRGARAAPRLLVTEASERWDLPLCGCLKRQIPGPQLCFLNARCTCCLGSDTAETSLLCKVVLEFGVERLSDLTSHPLDPELPFCPKYSCVQRKGPWTHTFHSTLFTQALLLCAQPCTAVSTRQS